MCRLCDDRDETINHIISKRRHNWVKKLKFDHTTKWYMHKLEFLRENESHKIIWDFEIQTDHPIQKTRPSDNLQKKRICNIMNFAIPANQSENQRKQKERQVLGFCSELRKGNGDTKM